MIALRVASFLPLCFFIGCSYTPTPPSPLPSSGTQVLHGTVYPDGTTTVWVQSPREGTFALALTEENPAGVPLGVAFGGPAGAAGHCETGDPVEMDTGSIPQQAPAPSAGLYCINVSDTGFVKAKGGVTFSLTAGLH